jgi:hypothetical protein
MLNLNRILALCVLAISANAQGNPSTVPDSILHVNKTDQRSIEFRVGSGSTVLAIGLADVNGKISWDDFCQRRYQPGETATIPNAGQVVTVITTNGTYGNIDKAGIDDLYQRWIAEQNVWHKWQDLAKSYRTDPKTFVQQITSALHSITLPQAPDVTRSVEDYGTWNALTLLKGNVLVSAQTAQDPRQAILLYLAHEVRTFDACVLAARSGSVQ